METIFEFRHALTQSGTQKGTDRARNRPSNRNRVDPEPRCQDGVKVGFARSGVLQGDVEDNGKHVVRREKQEEGKEHLRLPGC